MMIPRKRRTARKRRVLIVEDNRDTQELYARYLTSRGFDVDTASDGLQAIGIARNSRPDLIVMDLALPHLDGWETTRRLKRNPETGGIPVIACTGHSSHVSVERALDAGCDAYLVKPCLPQELFTEIRSRLSRHRPRS